VLIAQCIGSNLGKHFSFRLSADFQSRSHLVAVLESLVGVHIDTGSLAGVALLQLL
jgi:hypothetical protein